MEGKTGLYGPFVYVAMLFALLISGIVVAQALPEVIEAPGPAFAGDAIQGHGLARHDAISSGSVPGRVYNPDAGRCFWICNRGRCFWSCRGGW